MIKTIDQSRLVGLRLAKKIILKMYIIHKITKICKFRIILGKKIISYARRLFNLQNISIYEKTQIIRDSKSSL